jgi:hypothetical protein
MVDVTDGPDVAMRLGTLKLCFGHSHPSFCPAQLRGIFKTAAGYSGKRPCSSQKFWANLALTMPAERLI